MTDQDYIPVSGKVFNKEEINNAIEAARDGWWTEGRFAKQFESDFSKYLGIIYGLKPVFVDVDLNSLNANLEQIEKAITKKTKLIMIAHTLGKPYNMDRLMKIVRKNNLWLIEDCCDALGSKWNEQYLGTFGHLATFSFYPAHQITMGEGGAVATNNPLLHRLVRRFRDWGRDCWCDTGKDDTCHKRFKWKLGELPFGYDHKYIYSEIGFNLKLTDFQAAIGVAQLAKLPNFIKKRKENYNTLYSFFSNYKKWFILMKKEKKEDCSYFGFPIIIKEMAPFTRNQLTEYLEINKIGTRNIFSGNLLKHPAYLKIKNKFRIANSLKNSDTIMTNCFWLGVWPGINELKSKYILLKLTQFLNNYS